MDKSALRNAATLILHRNGAEGPEVLMGQRGTQAAFMPSKFVFPGGAVDAADARIDLSHTAPPDTLARLRHQAEPELAHACLVAAIRELWEEAGLVLGDPAPWPDPPADWHSFASTGHRPSARGLHFVFRAITPPGRPRRFDARFFLCAAEQLAGSPDDFSMATDELSQLQWIPLAHVRRFDLPFITQVVLAEIGPLIATGGAPASVPFVENDDPISSIRRLV